MLGAILAWLGGKIAGPLATLCALLFAFAALWQTARIDGLPLLGGGLKAQVAALTQNIAARDLTAAKAQAGALQARAALTQAGERQAGAQARALAATESQIQTVIRKVPVYVSAQSDSACRLPWGAVRLLDAAISGADPDTVRDRLAPGQPDDAASDVALSEAVALLAADFGAARQNAGQLTHLEKAVAAEGN